MKRNTAAREWRSKAAAARLCGVGVKRVCKLVKAQLLETRPNPTHPGRLEVFVPSLREVLNGKTPPAPTDAKSWAQARLARGGK